MAERRDLFQNQTGTLAASHGTVPGESLADAIDRMSCRALLAGTTAARGKVSLARKRISGCAREYLLRAQDIARIGKTRDDVVVGHPRVIPEDIGLRSSSNPKHRFTARSNREL